MCTKYERPPDPSNFIPCLQITVTKFAKMDKIGRIGSSFIFGIHFNCMYWSYFSCIIQSLEISNQVLKISQKFLNPSFSKKDDQSKYRSIGFQEAYSKAKPTMLLVQSSQVHEISSFAFDH